MPDDKVMAESARFQEQLWSGHERSIVGAPDDEGDAIASFARIGQEDTVLEVGCGTGRIATRLARRAGSVVGVDLLWPAVSATASGGVPVVQASAFRLPFARASFDVVVVNDVVHNLPAELSRVLLREAERVTRDRVFIGDIRNRVAGFLDPANAVRALRRGRMLEGSSINADFHRHARVKRSIAAAGLRIVAMQPAAKFVALWSRYAWYKRAYRVRPGRIGLVGFLIPAPYGYVKYDVLLEREPE